MSYFEELGLAEPILRALGTKGYSDPTPIQRQAIPALLEGRDLLGIAQTGTGKTAAFSLPSLHRLAANPMPRKPASCRMLVLSPTRELAAQIAENMRGYARNLNLIVECVFGGVPMPKHARKLVPGCDILVATPGRLLDLLDNRALTLRNVEIFVLDEADQMMDLGFIVPLKRISALLPKDRQSLFFSATMPKAIADLGKQFINNPVRVEVTPQATTAERVEQYVTFINQKEKQALLSVRLQAGLADGTIERALVFARTKHGADRVVRNLHAADIGAVAIHGNKSQAQRTAALQGFRKGAVRVLIATDIAARGIDVSGVSHVFNYELPNVAEQYVHRIGRTARAGADGVAQSFVAPDEKAYLRDIERLTGVKLAPLPLPEGFDKMAAALPAAAPVQGDDRGMDRNMRGRGGDRGGDRGGYRSGGQGGRFGDRNSGSDRGGDRGERSGGGFGGNRFGRPDRGPDHNADARPERRPALGVAPRGEQRGEARSEYRGEQRGEQRGAASRGDFRSDRARRPEGRPEGRSEYRPDRRPEGRAEGRPEYRNDNRGDRRPEARGDRPHGDRARGDSRSEGHRGRPDGAGEGQPRRFHPRGGSAAVGRHKGAVKRVG